MIESSPEILRIIEEARSDGWVLEPDAKRLFSLAGFSVPRFVFAWTTEEALGFAREIGFPVVAKIVSLRILHKSDVGGVVVGIGNDGRLVEVFERFQGLDGFLGVLVEEMLPGGIELILGAKIDLQFGPMIHIASNIPDFCSLPLATQFRATPPARTSWLLPVNCLAVRASFMTTSSVTS